jgi:hypothetical protein
MLYSFIKLLLIKAVFPLAKFSAVTSATATPWVTRQKIETSLSLSFCPRWPRQVQSRVVGIIANNVDNVNEP